MGCAAHGLRASKHFSSSGARMLVGFITVQDVLHHRTRGLGESQHGCSECDGAGGRESNKADALFEQQS